MVAELIPGSNQRVPAERREVAGLGGLILIGVALSVANGGVIALGLLVMACGVAVLSPASAVAAIPAALPFIYRPVAVQGGEWSLLELSIAVAGAGVGWHLALQVVRGRSYASVTELLSPWPTTAAAILLVGVGAISLTTVVDTRYLPASVREFRWVIVEPVIALLLFRWLLVRLEGRRLALLAYLGMAIAISLVGIVQLITQTGVVIADGVARATGPYRHPNNLALYLDRAAVLALALAVVPTVNRRRSSIVAAIVGVGLLATLSRGAAIAYVAGAGWVLGIARIRRGWQWVAAGVGLAAIVVAVLGVERLTDTGSSGSTSSRELIWSSSIEMIRDHPVTGIGLDQFVTQYGRRYVDPAGWPERYTSHPHNLVLDVWLRLGMTGLVVFAVIATCVIQIARAGWETGRDRALLIGASGALIAGIVHGMVDNGFFLPDLAVVTWFMVALIESCGRTSGIRFGSNDE